MENCCSLFCNDRFWFFPVQKLYRYCTLEEGIASCAIVCINLYESHKLKTRLCFHMHKGSKIPLSSHQAVLCHETFVLHCGVGSVLVGRVCAGSMDLCPVKAA